MVLGCFRWDNYNVLGRPLDFEVVDRKGCGRP